MKSKFLVCLSIVLLMAIPQGYADDIDIYINPTAPTGGAPIVMFTLDYRSNLGSTACGSGSCDFLLYQTDSTGGFILDSGGNKIPRTYTDASGNPQPYLTLSGGSTSYFNLLRGALKYVLQQVGSSGVNIGFAMSHNQGGGSSCTGPQSGSTKCTNGGYIISGAKPLTTQAARDAFYAKLDGLPVPGGSVAHAYQGKELFFELFRYFGGKAWYNMQNGWTDRGTNNTYNDDNPLDYGSGSTTAPASWDTTIISGNNYTSPVSSSSTCTKLYTVNILFQVSQQEDDSDTDIKSGLAGINLTGTNNKFSTVIRWMYDNDVVPDSIVSGKQNVISYFIVDSTKVNTTTQGYAAAGVGSNASVDPFVLSSDPETLIDTLSKIFKNILSTSTTFVAPSVAVNVYNRSQVRDEVYIAMFQAQQDGFPAWPGNIKKYKLGTDASGNKQIQDAVPSFAVAADGRVSFSAISYWTIPGDLPAPPTGVTTTLVAGKDGRAVDRGGAGSKIPGFKLNCASSADTSCYPGNYSPGLTNPGGNTTNISARKMFTEPAPGSYTNGTPTALLALNADITTATALQSDFGATGVGSCDSSDTNPNSACNLLMYARGAVYVDVSGTPTLKANSWIMGDLLHSRPLAVNYGARSGTSYTADNPDIRIVAGGNDGVMHMFRNTREGGAPAPNADSSDGVETWAFMPREVMSTISTLKANSVVSPPHPYTVDGAPNVYVLDWNGNGNIESMDSNGNTDKVLLFFGLRRGGTVYYALDITNPDDPKMLWKIKRGDTGFAELGQTWSTPKIAMMLFNGSTTSQPVLIFGGGYDPNKDTHPGHGGYTATGLGSDDSQGNAVFIVNAQTGALIWKAVKGSSTGYDAATKSYTHPDLVDSIPSDVLVVDSDGNGLADRLYVGDTGGVVWRVDLSCRNQDGSGTNADGTPLCAGGGWKITPMFSVGRHYNSTVADDRRFFYPAAYVQSTDTTGDFDAVIIGTGDRENPKDTSVTNWFYMFKDRDTVSGSLSQYSGVITHTQFGDVTNDCLQDNPGAGCNPDLTHGWRMKLECPNLASATVCGEKDLAIPVVLDGKIFFDTYIPAAATASSGSCSLAEGNGLSYAVGLQNGEAVEDFNVTNNTTSQKLHKGDRFSELVSGGIPAEIVPLGQGDYLRPDLNIRRTSVKSGYKTFWYEKYRH